MPEEDIKWLKEMAKSRGRNELTPEEITRIFNDDLDDLDNMLENLAEDYDKDDEDDNRLPHDFLSIVNYLRGTEAFYDIDLYKLPPYAAYGEDNIYEMRAVVNADKVNEILRG